LFTFRGDLSYLCTPPAGKIGYAAQTPWIFNESLRENVLFGSAFDAEWFQRVLSACALEPDLDVVCLFVGCPPSRFLVLAVFSSFLRVI
jgi:hypothetical protein